jgi:hypothetical protein
MLLPAWQPECLACMVMQGRVWQGVVMEGRVCLPHSPFHHHTRCRHLRNRLVGLGDIDSTSDAVESTNLASICRFCGDASNAVVGCI